MRWSTAQHLVKKCALNYIIIAIIDTYQTPPVYAFIVSDPLNDFWSQVLRCAAEGECSLFRVPSVDSLFAQAKISDLQVTIVVEKYIFRL